MCSIFGSADRDEFFKLAKLNSYRGTHSHSVAAVSLYHQTSLYSLDKGFGPLPEVVLPTSKDGFLYIGHQQAPTTKAKEDTNIHPSEGFGHLWHNGIIKEHQVKKWQKEYDMDDAWDTKLLHRHIERKQFEGLSEADGSFACLYHFLGSLYLFRNDNCPMFVKGSTFSSTKFDGSESIDSNIVYKFNYNNAWVKTTRAFKTKTEFFWSPT